MREIEKKAAELLEKCETVTLCSVTEEGYPRPCVVSKLRSYGFRTFFIGTSLDGRKTVQFQNNSKAGASFELDHDSVTMIGTVTVHTDRRALDACWQDWMEEHFEGGRADPNYCILQFTAEEATFWIGQEFCTYRYPRVDSRCGIRCSQADCKKEYGFDCRGCARELDAPWGHCKIKACCEEKGLLHCGECPDFPCEELNAFAYDTENGDGTGERLGVCRCWQKETREV